MIHLNIGSNLDSTYGSRFDNITIAINLLIDSKIKIKKISNFYETPSYPNNNFPKFLNVGLFIEYNSNYPNLFKIIKQKMVELLNIIRRERALPGGPASTADVQRFHNEVRNQNGSPFPVDCPV